MNMNIKQSNASNQNRSNPQTKINLRPILNSVVKIFLSNFTRKVPVSLILCQNLVQVDVFSMGTQKKTVI